MKRYLIFLVIALIAVKGAGQGEKGDLLKEFRTASPVFLAGEVFVEGEQMKSLTHYLTKTAQYPQESFYCRQQGTEVIEFMITSTGEPTAFKIINSVCPKIDVEIIRALNSTCGKWIPGTVNGKPADMKQEIAVVFRLCSKKEFISRAKKIAEKGNRFLFEQKKPEKALRYINRAITFLPNEESLLAARGLCKCSLGDTTGAVTDWQRILTLAERNDRYFISEGSVVQMEELPEKFMEIICLQD